MSGANLDCAYMKCTHQGNIIELVTRPDCYHRIRVGCSINRFGLSFGITKEQRLEVEGLMKKAFAKMTGGLAGLSYPLQVRNRNL